MPRLPAEALDWTIPPLVAEILNGEPDEYQVRYLAQLLRTLGRPELPEVVNWMLNSSDADMSDVAEDFC